jgi:hypothetical protein
MKTLYVELLRKMNLIYTLIDETLRLVDNQPYFKALTSELNPSAQRCLTRLFTGNFAS